MSLSSQGQLSKMVDLLELRDKALQLLSHKHWAIRTFLTDREQQCHLCGSVIGFSRMPNGVHRMRFYAIRGNGRFQVIMCRYCMLSTKNGVVESGSYNSLLKSLRSLK